MPTSYMYILRCFDENLYVGSTKNLTRRFNQHHNGEGANYTKKRLPVKLVYFEEFTRIDHAFNREKQIQRWKRKKKKALIAGKFDELVLLAKKSFDTFSAGAENTQEPFSQL